MAKTITVDDLLTNGRPDPAKWKKLTDLQLFHVVEHVEKLAAGLGTQKVEDNPADFAARLDPTFKIPPHIRYISDRLKAAAKLGGARICISIPPRHGKSLIVGRWYPLWRLTKNPRLRIIYVSYEEHFATTNAGLPTRDLVASHGQQLKLAFHPDKTAAGDWQLTAGGGMISLGAGGAIMGRGAHDLIVDDPIKNEEEAESERQRDKLWSWWQTSPMTRLEPGANAVVILSRWHEDDLVGRIMKASDSGDGPKWDYIKIPAEAEAGDPVGREPGQWLWPQRFASPSDPFGNLHYEDAKRSMSPYHWSAVFQQSPTPEGGGLIKRGWLERFYAKLPEKIDQWVQSWDLAMSDKETANYTVGQLWARSGVDLYLVDQIRTHGDITEMVQAVKGWIQRYPKAITKLIERKASGEALIQLLRRETPGVIPIDPRSSKKARVEAAIPAMQAGNVHLPEVDGTVPRWVWEFIEECASFPKGKYDDQVDAMTQALNFMLPRGWLDADRRAKESAHLAKPALNPIEALRKSLSDNVKAALKRADEHYANQEDESQVIW